MITDLRARLDWRREDTRYAAATVAALAVATLLIAHSFGLSARFGSLFAPLGNGVRSLFERPAITAGVQSVRVTAEPVAVVPPPPPAPAPEPEPEPPVPVEVAAPPPPPPPAPEQPAEAPEAPPPPLETATEPAGDLVGTVVRVVGRLTDALTQTAGGLLGLL